MVKQKMHSFCILALTEHHIKRPVQCTMVNLTPFLSVGFKAATIHYRGLVPTLGLRRILGLEKTCYVIFALVEL